LTATISVGLNCARSSATVIWNGLPAALPPMRITCLSPSIEVGIAALW
jgi:hypothetical protein